MDVGVMEQSRALATLTLLLHFIITRLPERPDEAGTPVQKSI